MDPSSRLRPVTAWFVSMDVPGAGDTVVLEPQMPPPPGLPWRPAGQPGLGPRGQRGAQPRGTHQLQRRRPPAGRAQACFCSGDSRGDTRSWLGRSGPSGARPSGGREGAQGGRAGRVKAAPAMAAFLGGVAGTLGAACDICAREGESVRGGGWKGGRHTQDAHLARLCSGARSQEAEVKVKRCGGAAAPFARPTPRRNSAPAPPPHLALCPC